MAENIFCSKCGAQNSSESQFCQKCGASLWPLGSVPQSTTPAHASQLASSQRTAYAAAPSSPYGGFWIRFLAYFIDRIIVGVVAAPFYFIMVFPRMVPILEDAQRNQHPSPDMVEAVVGTALTFGFFALVGTWLYDALLTSSAWQGTVGKKVLRLKVTDEAGNRISFARATGRFFGKILSAMIMYIGFIMIGFTDRKRGLHDMIAGTLVMKY